MVVGGPLCVPSLFLPVFPIALLFRRFILIAWHFSACHRALARGKWPVGNQQPTEASFPGPMAR